MKPKWTLPKCCTVSAITIAMLCGVMGYSWHGFLLMLSEKNEELAVLKASCDETKATLSDITAERNELLEIMVAQDGLIQSQTAALSHAKSNSSAEKAAIAAQARKLSELKDRLNAKPSYQPPARQSEKVGRGTANDVKRINRLWQR